MFKVVRVIVTSGNASVIIEQESTIDVQGGPSELGFSIGFSKSRNVMGLLKFKNLNVIGSRFRESYDSTHILNLVHAKR